MKWKVVAGAFAVGTLLSVILLEVFAKSQDTLGLIPLPQRVERQRGEFVLGPDARILSSPASRASAEYLAEQLKTATGYLLPMGGHADGLTGNITLTLSNAPASLGSEGYQLEIQSDSVLIRASTEAGLFYGAQTLLQLLPPQIFSPHLVNSVRWKTPCVSIEDRPRFAWRGYMLDVSRHFFTKQEVKKLLDTMALHKLNVFHWHLTDDQGWRIEIKKYPRLTEVGAWRKRIGFNLNPKASTAYGPDGRYGGFYTQADIREIVNYAHARHITVVPEIEMPGHSSAALAAYPEFSCFPEQGHFSTDSGAGIFAGVYCAGKDSTFDFLQDVLTEVMELFPGQYIHVGGDEVPKQNWKDCSRCQARLQQEGLKTETELESYFMRRIASFLQEHGRSLIGWTEIAQGGLPPGASVMDWLGGAAEVANAGHDVVMTPNEYCYFDYYQSRDRVGEPPASGAYLPLKKVYSFDPIPSGLSASYRNRIIGIQANVWTEYMPSLKQVEYMTFPRLCALSEVAWSPAGPRDWDTFDHRLKYHLNRLELMGVNYRRSYSGVLGRN